MTPDQTESIVPPHVLPETRPRLAAAAFPFTELATPKLNLPRTISLRQWMMGLFMVPLVTAVGLTSWFSLRNGQKAVSDLAQQAQAEVGDRVATHLDNYLSVPRQMNQINLDAQALGLLDLRDFKAVGKYFCKQMQTLNIGYISYANTQGEFIGVERLNTGKLLINEALQSIAPGQQYVYQTNDQGDRTQLINKVAYDPRTEAWYTDAVRQQKPVWSQIYQWDDKPEVLSIAATAPVYDENKTLIGVMGIDLILTQINQFLNQLNLGRAARVFIVERDGQLVGNSGTAPPYSLKDDKPQRLTASHSSDPLIQATAQYLQQALGGFEMIQHPQRADFHFQGEQRFIQVLPWRDRLGLDWRIVVVTSESDFLAQINANTRNTIVLCGVALLVAMALGILASRWIANPVVQLSQASAAIARGDLDQTVAEKGIGEIRGLAQSFNQMVEQLQASFAELAAANQVLEQRVADRTATIQAESQALQHDVGHLLTIVSAVEEGDLTAEAEVSPRATGLVADTLNRLIERLGQIMATVLDTAAQVTQGAETLEQLAITVAQDAQQQTHAVEQVQALMENVNTLSQDAAEQAVATGEAMELTRSAIRQGQQEITTMTQGIEVLQQDTEQMVKRTQTLSNYLELAAQFTKDQKQIAAMTRILAVNASMLATRATTQQDPEQMALITHEFETIATQVNQLANQTNQSLVLLQQRTSQIQTVMSGLNYDVQEMSQQVSHFSTGVEQSQQAFATIQAVSDQVGHMGQQVTQSNQTIVAAAQTALQSIRQISAIAVEASDRANITQTQAQHMGQLARTLFQKVAFFRLPPSAPAASDPDSTIVPASQPRLS